VLRWDKYWLTVPAAVLLGFLALITLVETTGVVFDAVPLMIMKPPQLLLILGTVGTRLASNGFSIIYFALVFRAILR